MARRYSVLYGDRDGPDLSGLWTTEGKLPGTGNVQKTSLNAEVELLKAITLHLTVYGDDDDDDDDDDDNNNNNNNNNNIL